MDGIVTARPKVLLVDDEPSIIVAASRMLGKLYDIHGANSGADALRLIEAHGVFPVVISDLRMPGMDGISFLEQVRERTPDSVRMLLTGHADANSAIEAVNRSHIFRMLLKPCPREDLRAAIELGYKQYQLLTSERELLSETLHGSIEMLTEALAMAKPHIFGRALRVKRWVSDVLQILDISERWSTEVAAMLAHVACITLPTDLCQKVEDSVNLSIEESNILAELPRIAEKLVAHIPRLEPVREILRNQGVRYDRLNPSDSIAHIGACVLTAVWDFESMLKNKTVDEAVQTMRERKGNYDPLVLQALENIRDHRPTGTDLRAIPIDELAPGMVLASDVKTCTGILVVPKGRELSPTLVQRISNFAAGAGIQEPVQIMV